MRPVPSDEGSSSDFPYLIIPLPQRYTGPSVTLFEAYFSLAATDLAGVVPVIFIGAEVDVYPFSKGALQVTHMQSLEYFLVTQG